MRFSNRLKSSLKINIDLHISFRLNLVNNALVENEM